MNSKQISSVLASIFYFQNKVFTSFKDRNKAGMWLNKLWLEVARALYSTCGYQAFEGDNSFRSRFYMEFLSVRQFSADILDGGEGL